MATIEELSAALVKADAAGNTADAKAFADAIRQMRSSEMAAPATPAQPETGIPGPRKQGFLETLVNRPLEVLEVPLAVGANIATGLPIYLSGALGPEAQRTVARNIQYQPRGQLAQEALEGMAKAADVAKIPPYMGTIGTGMATRVPTARETRAGVAKVVGPSEAKIAKMTAEDYARGPQIDAAAEAQRLGLAINPTDIQPTVGPRVTAAIAGPRGPEALAKFNQPRVREIQLADMGLPTTAPLNKVETFDLARKQVAKPYDDVAKLPTMTADDSVRAALERLRPDESQIGAEKYAAAINHLVDDALTKTDAGLTGAQLLDNVKTLRQRAQKTYKNKNADLASLDVADTNLAIANALESMIESNISNPKLLDQFRAARQKMARTYAYEGATDLNTGVLDVKKLSRITSKDNMLTGDIASLGQIAGNFPEVFSTKAPSSWYSLPRVSRSGVPGAIGAYIGSQYGGIEGAIAGGALGGALGEGGGIFAARRMASPKYQAGLNLRDLRSPVANQLAAQQAPIPQERALVPYQAPVEVLGPDEGTYFPNFEMRGEGRAASRVVWDPVSKTYRAELAPESTVQTAAPEVRNMLGYDPNVPVQGQPRAFEIMRERERSLSMRQGQQAEAQQAAAETMANVGKRTTNRAMNLEWDPVAQVYREAAPQGAGGVVGGLTPLESAVQKMSGQVMPETTGTTFKTTRVTPKTGAEPYTRITRKEGETAFERKGQAFAMTAEEKIAWNKAKADLAEVMPGMKSLTDEAIAAKMMDREWTAQAVANARAKVETLARQEAALAEQLANRDNLRLLAREIEAKNKQLAKIQADRQNLMAFAEQMEEGLRGPRPDVSGKQQGPKTRAAIRNRLIRDENQNALAK